MMKVDEKMKGAEKVSPEQSMSEQVRAMVSNVQESGMRKDGRPVGAERVEPMPKRLTAKQRLFVSLIVQGHTRKDAYKHAYDIRTEDESNIATGAHRVANIPHVKDALDKSLGRLEDALLMDEKETRRFVMSELITHAKDMKGESAKLKALELIGKSVGMFIERTESTVETVTVEGLKTELQHHLDLLDQVVKH